MKKTKTIRTERIKSRKTERQKNRKNRRKKRKRRKRRRTKRNQQEERKPTGRKDLNGGSGPDGWSCVGLLVGLKVSRLRRTHTQTHTARCSVTRVSARSPQHSDVGLEHRHDDVIVQSDVLHHPLHRFLKLLALIQQLDTSGGETA